MIKPYSLIFVLGLFSAGCVTAPDSKTRIASAEQLASKHGWHKRVIDTSSFKLMSFTANRLPDSIDKLTIYIEGDGLAWVSSRKPSNDPTPINPVALKLALTDSSDAVAYIARPCQYISDKYCEKKYWTSARFAPVVIEATNKAISQLKKQANTQKLQLIGFSGGGAVAALVAARRDDVVSLVTIAGNLDHKVWTTLHNVSELTDSLNAADYWQQLSEIKQVHFVGGKDNIMPLEVAQSYQQHFPIEHQPQIKIIESADHLCCWIKLWPNLRKLFDQN